MTAHQHAERRKAVQQPSAHRFINFASSTFFRIGPARDTGAMPADNSWGQNLPAMAQFQFPRRGATHKFSAAPLLMLWRQCFSPPSFIGTTRPEHQMTYDILCTQDSVQHKPPPWKNMYRSIQPSPPLTPSSQSQCRCFPPYNTSSHKSSAAARPLNPPSRRCRPC